jgi:beta-1,4-mannosyl-glycoprotein beta-1,4-N-acetylglucosaminyltransferase
VRIFDTFPFDGELDLLAFHLEQTFDQVDHYILIEAAQTYRGRPKPLIFAENEQRFAWARHKIRHVKLSGLGPDTTTPRARAAVQRNAILLALADAAPEDVVLLLDLDEIPSPSLLDRLRRHGLDAPRRLAMTRHYCFADLLGPRSPCCPTGLDPFPAAAPWLKPAKWDDLSSDWFGHSGVAAPFRSLAANAPFDLRFCLPLAEPIAEAGRHFNSVDPSARLGGKLARVFHEEYDGERERAPEHLDRCRLYWVHHRGWWQAERPDGPLPEDVAALVKRHPALGAGPEPSRLARRLVRTWAWARLWKSLPDGLVKTIDRHFESLRPLLAGPLLILDLARAVLGSALRLAPRRPVPESLHH